MSLSIGNTVSLIGLQLALIAMLGALEPAFRGLAAGLLLLASLGQVPGLIERKNALLGE